MRSLLLVGGGLLIGVGLSWGEATRQAEQSAKKRYEEQLEIHKRALDRSGRTINFTVEGPKETEGELDKPDTSEDAITVGGEMIVETPIASPDYLAAAATYGERENFVNDTALGMAYIEEEDYEESDGREKEQVLIFMDSDGNARFTINGEEIDNWKELVGEHILVDLYKAGMTDPTGDPILYVRNHQQDVDFEVSRVIP